MKTLKSLPPWGFRNLGVHLEARQFFNLPYHFNSLSRAQQGAIPTISQLLCPGDQFVRQIACLKGPETYILLWAVLISTPKP